MVNKHTFITAEGKVEKRESMNRIYTHVIVARRDIKRDREQELGASRRAFHLSNFDYFTKVLATGAGNSYMGNGFAHKVDQTMIDEATIRLEGHTTFEAYLAAKQNAAVAGLGAGDVGPEQVLQWSMSQANALKGIGQFSKRPFKFIRVEPVTSVQAAA